MTKATKYAVTIAVVLLVAAASYALWPRHAQLILLAVFAATVPFANAWIKPDAGWGILLRRRRDVVAYVLAMTVTLLALWSLTLSWVPPIVALPPLIIAMLGWGVFVVASVGPDGLGKLLMPPRSSRPDAD